MNSISKKNNHFRYRFKRDQLAIPYGIFMLICVVLPILLIAYYSFVDKNGNFIWFNNFIEIFSDSKNFIVIKNSLWIGFLNAIICIIISFPICLILSNSKYNKNKVLVYLFVLPMWINFVIRLIATKELLEYIGITPTTSSDELRVIIGMVYNYLPFAILPIYSTMLKFDRSQIEASLDLGARPIHTFFKLIIPMSIPGVVSAFTMTFMPTMSSYVIAGKMSEGNYTIIGTKINNYFEQTNYNLGSALSLIMLMMIGITMFITRNVEKEEKSGGNLW